MATPCEPDDDFEQGTPSEVVAGDPMGIGRGIKQPWVQMALKPCKGKEERH